MKNQKVAIRYAKALLNLSKNEEESTLYLNNFNSLCAIFQEDSTLLAFLLNKNIAKDDKKALLKRLFFGKEAVLFTLENNFISLLFVLTNKGRLDIIRQVRVSYAELYYEKYGYIGAKVKAASPLTDEEIAKLTDVLANNYAKKIILETDIDQDIIGGLTIQIGDLVYDGSLRTQFKQLTERLAK